MLTQSDIEWIKANRAEVTECRTEPVTLVREVVGEVDPYTGESTSGTSTEMVQAVWKEYSTVANGDRSVVNGVEIRQDDVQVSFDSSVDLANVVFVQRDGVNFTIITIDEKGLGAVNRLECVVRRTT